MHGFAVIKYVVVRTHGLKIQMGSDLCYPARKIRLRFSAGGFFSFRQKRRDLNKEGESRRLSEENSPGDCFRRRGQRAKRGDRRNAPEKSLRAGQKIDKFRLVDFFYPLRKQWYIINDSGAIVVSHQSVRTVYHHAKRVSNNFRNDDIQNFVLMICNSFRN